MRLLVGSALALVLATAACASPTDDSEDAANGAAAVSEDALTLRDVQASIKSLTSLRDGAELGPYGADGARVEGCWRNPAGNKLSDLKKAFYCSMPLEFRLCNTVVLLATDDTKIDERYRGYLSCKAKVETVFGHRGLFAFDANTDAVYEQLFLRDKTLSSADTKTIVDAEKPTFGSKSFTRLLLEIGWSLTKEATDLALAGLSSLASDYHASTNDDPR